MVNDNQNQMLSELAGLNPNPVLTLSKEGKVLYSNDPAQSLLKDWGLDKGKALPDTWKELAGDVCTSGTSKEIKDSIYERLFSVTAVPNNKKDAANIYITEITEFLSKYSDSVFKISQYFNKLPVMAYNIDFDGNIINCNQMALDKLGYSKRDLIGKEVFSAVYAPASHEKVKQAFENWKKTSWVKGEELQVMTKDGRILDILLYVSTIFDIEGNPAYSLGTHIDITERKKFEADLKASNLELKAKQEKLELRRKKLRELNSKLSTIKEQENKRIAQKIHNEIIQPLIALDIKAKSFGKTIAETDFEAALTDVRELIKKLIETSREITSSLNDPILDELGLEDAIKNYLTEEIGKKYHIKTDFTGHIEVQRLDKDAISFIYHSIKELLFNALKHANPNHIQVCIEQKNDDVEICIEDDGLGFGGNFKENDYGSSFGLYYIHEKASQYGGSLAIDSKQGTGSQVTLRIPLNNKVERGEKSNEIINR